MRDQQAAVAALPPKKEDYAVAERRDREREIAAEWVALTDIYPDRKGKDEPFLEWDHTPANLTELAELIGVARVTVSRWYNTDPHFQKAVQRKKRKYAANNLIEHLHDVDMILVARAKSGDTRAMKIFYDQLSQREGWTDADITRFGLHNKDEMIITIQTLVAKIKSNTSNGEIQEAEIVSESD